VFTGTRAGPGASLRQKRERSTRTRAPCHRMEGWSEQRGGADRISKNTSAPLPPSPCNRACASGQWPRIAGELELAVDGVFSYRVGGRPLGGDELRLCMELCLRIASGSAVEAAVSRSEAVPRSRRLSRDDAPDTPLWSHSPPWFLALRTGPSASCRRTALLPESRVPAGGGGSWESNVYACVWGGAGAWASLCMDVGVGGERVATARCSAHEIHRSGWDDEMREAHLAVGGDRARAAVVRVIVGVSAAARQPTPGRKTFSR
jgi:hypothetical protein